MMMKMIKALQNIMKVQTLTNWIQIYLKTAEKMFSLKLILSMKMEYEVPQIVTQILKINIQ